MPFRISGKLNIVKNIDRFKKIHHQKNSWIRGWTYRKEVWILDPSVWCRDNCVNKTKELLMHEFTHLWTYEMLDTPPIELLPAWFIEGIAGIAANEDYRRFKRNKICQRLQTQKLVLSSFDNYDSIKKISKDLFYSFSLRFTEFLTQRSFSEIKRLLLCTKKDKNFSACIKKVLKKDLQVAYQEFCPALIIKQP